MSSQEAKSMAHLEKFEVFEHQTGRIITTTTTAKGARAAVDRLDNAYGGYRYGYRPIGGWNKGSGR